MKIGDKVIIRSRDAGVFYGVLLKKSKSSVVLARSRRLWYWDGAASLSELSQYGVGKPGNCKFPREIPEHEISGWCEILPTTREAQKSIEEVPEWQSRT